MSDFIQTGAITTLHNLRTRSLDSLESELESFSRKRKMALILPSLYSELEGPALSHIVSELRHARYIDQIIVGLDRADAEQFEKARHFFDGLPQKLKILWHDGPRMTAVDERLEKEGLAPLQAGKGRNVWYCFGFLLAQGQSDVIALHDCDILTYSREMPARLFYPLVNPKFDFSFNKGFYSRINGDKYSGRVTRLFVMPLIRSLKKILGPMDYLDYLDSFRYPLSGEFAFRTDVMNTIRIPGDWGLEIGVLSEAYRNINQRHICQVDIADNYDHKHQDLSPEDLTAGLSRMSVEIAKSIYRKLATEGVQLSTEFFRTLKATYLRTALDMLEQYQCDATINGLSIDCHQEEETIEVYLQGIIAAGESFLANPMEVPFIPNWRRIFSAVPEIGEQILEAVEKDNNGH
jgi:glucosyl-3-phosphoglycerate synthase